MVRTVWTGLSVSNFDWTFTQLQDSLLLERSYSLSIKTQASSYPSFCWSCSEKCKILNRKFLCWYVGYAVDFFMTTAPSIWSIICLKAVKNRRVLTKCTDTMSYHSYCWQNCLCLAAGDSQLVPAAAGPGCVSACQPPESVWERQAVWAGPALYRLCQEFAHQRATCGVPLLWCRRHAKHRVRHQHTTAVRDRQASKMVQVDRQMCCRVMFLNPERAEWLLWKTAFFPQQDTEKTSNTLAQHLCFIVQSRPKW